MAHGPFVHQNFSSKTILIENEFSIKVFLFLLILFYTLHMKDFDTFVGSIMTPCRHFVDLK